jgi:hypothetical protein
MDIIPNIKMVMPDADQTTEITCSACTKRTYHAHEQFWNKLATLNAFATNGNSTLSQHKKMRLYVNVIESPR